MHNADLVTDTNNGVICDISMDIVFVCQNCSIQCPQENNRDLSIPKLKFRFFLLVLLSCCWLDGAKERRLDCILKYRSLQSQEKYSVL